MKRIIKRIAIAIAVTLVLGSTGIAVAVVVREDRTFEAPYPELSASTDPAVIARGKYLVHGPAHCVACHAEPGAPQSTEPMLSGGFAFHLPVGTFYAANITNDASTGIGRYSDRELARALRYGVHPSGRAMLPFMTFGDLADDDLVAILSYLRARPGSTHAVPAHDVNALGRFAKAFLLEPTGPSGPVARHVTPAPTVEYGAYLANTVANCSGCHTRRSKRTGEPLGTPFAGGMEVEGHDVAHTTYVTPNLTPHPTKGHITSWTEEQFIARFQHAAATPSPMPWTSFRTLSTDDLRALYRYLRSLPPAVE